MKLFPYDQRFDRCPVCMVALFDGKATLGGRPEKVSGTIRAQEAEETCERCFRSPHFTHAIFGEFSSLKRIGSYAFPADGMSEVTILDGVERASCFETGRLTRENRHRCITFGELRSLKRIGFRGF